MKCLLMLLSTLLALGGFAQESTDLKSSLNTAKALFEKEEYDSAYYYSNLVVQSEPDNTIALKLQADILSYQSKNLEAIELYQKVIYLEKKKSNPDHSLLAKTQNDLSWTYLTLGLYEKSIQNYRQSVTYAKSANDSHELAAAYYGLSTSFTRLANYDSAIIHIQRAHGIDVALGDSSAISSDLNTLGFLFGSKGDFEKAIYYYQSSMNYLKADELPKWAVRYNNLGMMKIELARYDEAKTDIEQSLQIHRSLGDSTKAAERTMNLAKLFHRTGEFDKALTDINYAINYFLKAGHQALELRGRVTLASMLIDLKKWKAAERELSHCVQLATDNRLLEDLVNSLQMLVNVYESENNITAAYSTLKSYRHFSDSLKKSDQLKSINDLELKFITNIKEKEIELLQLSMAKSESELNSRKRENAILIAIGVAGVIAFAIFIMLQRQKHKLSQALLSQEVDTLRAQINAVFGGGVSQLNITMEQINNGLYRPLSEREFEILRLAISDKNNSEIAEAVFLSVNTVKYHLRKIYDKLGVSNRKEALELVLSKTQ